MYVSNTVGESAGALKLVLIDFPIGLSIGMLFHCKKAHTIFHQAHAAASCNHCALF